MTVPHQSFYRRSGEPPQLGTARTVDRVGGWLSLLCAVHCAVVPLVVLLGALGLPVVAGFGFFELFADERFELGFSLIAVVLVAVSLGLGWRGADNSTARRPMLIGFVIGLGLIGGSHGIPGPEWFAHLVLVAGALVLSFTHRRSLRVVHLHDAACEHPSAPASAPLAP